MEAQHINQYLLPIKAAKDFFFFLTTKPKNNLAIPSANQGTKGLESQPLLSGR